MQLAPIQLRARNECRILERMQSVGDAMTTSQLAESLNLSPKAVSNILRDLVSAEVVAFVGKEAEGRLYQILALPSARSRSASARPAAVLKPTAA